MAKHRIQYWPVFLRVSQQFTGCAGLRPYKLHDHVLEMGFHIMPEFWGRGLACEAGQAVINFAFESLGTEALFAGHHPENHASRQVLSKLGFRFTHEEIYPPTGEIHPSYLLTSSDWRRANH